MADQKPPAPNPNVAPEPQLAPMEQITILLKEYDTLRSEIIARTTAEFQIVGAAALLFIAGITSLERGYKLPLAYTLFGACLLVAVAAFLVALIGISRPHKQVAALEHRINGLAGGQFLTWEGPIRWWGLSRRRVPAHTVRANLREHDEPQVRTIPAPATLIFGFQEEWKDFAARNSLFVQRFPNLEKALKIAFHRTVQLSEPIDKFVFMFGRVCVEDFFEVALCSGNGNGHAALKLLRGLYERAVTLRYLHEHPSELEDFLDYYHVGQRKLMIACRNTMGEQLFSAEQVAEIEAAFAAIREKFMVTDCPKCGTERLNHNWNKLDMVAMAGKTRLGKLIVPAYFVPLRQAHATVASMVSKMTAGEDQRIAFQDAAQRKEADDALRVAQIMMLDVLDVQEEHFAVTGLKEQIESCRADFLEVWGKFKET